MLAGLPASQPASRLASQPASQPSSHPASQQPISNSQLQALSCQQPAASSNEPAASSQQSTARQAANVLQMLGCTSYASSLTLYMIYMQTPHYTRRLVLQVQIWLLGTLRRAKSRLTTSRIAAAMTSEVPQQPREITARRHCVCHACVRRAPLARLFSDGPWPKQHAQCQWAVQSKQREACVTCVEV